MVAKIRIGFAYMWVYGFALLLLVIFAQLFKYTIRRPRPENLRNKRWGTDLRGREDGTFSMPSGDSACAANYALFVAVTMDFPLIWVIVPLVMLGRVFYHCHFLGDTVMGVLLGLCCQSAIFSF